MVDMASFFEACGQDTFGGVCGYRFREDDSGMPEVLVKPECVVELLPVVDLLGKARADFPEGAVPVQRLPCRRFEQKERIELSIQRDVDKFPRFLCHV